MFIMTWDNIINIFVQPWVGNRSDHTWNRFGRRKPWILIGLPIALLGFRLNPAGAVSAGSGSLHPGDQLWHGAFPLAGGVVAG